MNKTIENHYSDNLTFKILLKVLININFFILERNSSKIKYYIIFIIEVVEDCFFIVAVKQLPWIDRHKKGHKPADQFTPLAFNLWKGFLRIESKL